MAEKRKDSKGRILRTGESQMKDGRYRYQYIDKIAGKRKCVYALDIVTLREKEKNITLDISDKIRTDCKKVTVNNLFDEYIATKKIEATTKFNYIRIYNNHLRDGIGKLAIVNVTSLVIRRKYTEMAKKDYSSSTIKGVHNLLFQTLQCAVNEDIIRKNPATGCLKGYMGNKKEKEALSLQEQKQLLSFVKSSSVYSIYYPMLKYMLGTACRVGEVIGITWNDVDMKNKNININHQLIYKNIGSGTKLYIKKTKTEAGIRNIPMVDIVYEALLEQRKLQLSLGINRDYEVDGYKSFIFTSKSGRPLQPSAVNNALKNIVDAYNRNEKKRAEKEQREAVLMPSISAHTLRHTGCTRMAEAGIDIKTLQYIMGHSSINVTMNVYNHVKQERAISEIQKLNLKLQAI